MENNSELVNRLNSVYALIESCVNNDNIINEEEFQKIQALKRELNISTEHIHEMKKIDNERILYLQIFLLQLDGFFDSSERKEKEYYREIFGYTEDELMELEKKVKGDNDYERKRLSRIIDPTIIEEEKDRSIPESIKKIVWDRDGGKCKLCGSIENLEFDHDIPFSKGGSNSTDNIRVLCRNCNRGKSANISFDDDK